MPVLPTYIPVDLATWKTFKSENLIQFVPRTSRNPSIKIYQTVFTPFFDEPQYSNTPFEFEWDWEDRYWVRGEKKVGHNSYFFNKGFNVNKAHVLFKDGGNAYEMEAAAYCFTKLINEQGLLVAMMHPAHTGDDAVDQAVQRITKARNFIINLLVSTAKSGN